MNDTAVNILTSSDVEAKILRMAFEIYELHYGQDSFVMIGIDERGGFLAEKLKAEIERISPLQVELIHAYLDREEGDPLIGIDLEVEALEDLKGKQILVVDDVLYSGHTLLNVVSILLQARPASIRTAVLIDRGHRTVPVAADVIGMQLATTIQQHVQVTLDATHGNAEAFLM